MRQRITSVRSILALLLRADLLLVRICARSAGRSLGRGAAITFSWVGNGLIYPMLGGLLMLTGSARALNVIVTGAINIAVVHCLYPPIKRQMARPRPYHSHPDLAPLLRVLDKHSFPSGHAMTLTAALVPIVVAIPRTLLASLALWGIMSWARLATAHHYPSDVLGGTAIGLLVSYPISHFFITLIAPLP